MNHDSQSPSPAQAPRLLDSITSIRHAVRQRRAGVDDLLDVVDDHQARPMTTPSLISDAVLEAHSDQCARLDRDMPLGTIRGLLKWNPGLLLWQFEPEDGDELERVVCRNLRLDADVEVTVR